MRLLLIGVVLLVAAGLLLPYFLDVDRYRTLIAGIIESETGRKVTIGKIRARLLPSVGFVVQDFRLSNPPGFPPGDLLAVEAIRGKLTWGPLLRRELRLSAIELVRPKLMLLEDARGKNNYSFPAGAGKRTKTTEAASAQGLRLSDIERIGLSEAEITIGRVAGRESVAPPALRLRKLSLKLDHVALDPLDFKKWQGEAQLGGVLMELAAWKGPIEVRSGSLTLREGGIESEFRVALGKAADCKGSLRVADLERAVPTFELSTAQLDVDQLLAGMAASGPAEPHQPKAPRIELVAQGRLAAERIHWASLTGNNASAELRLFSDRVELWPLTVELYGGSLQISARADRMVTPERFSANVQVRNVDVGKLLSAASPAARGKLSGTGELTVQLFGALGVEWQKSLSGSGKFAIRDGHLPRINLTGPLGSVAKVAGLAGETPFKVIQGDLAVAQARIASRQIHLDASQITADLHGSCGLDSTLDYDGQAVVTPGAGGAGAPSPVDAIAGILGSVLKRNVNRATVPFALRGTLRDPKIEPGRSLPSIEQGVPAQPPQAQPQKKQSIIDLFRRP